jgi:HAD superfamily hydrolase (TIGR01509 family)
MLQAAIFDIDGTLIDSVDAHALAWQEAFKYFGKDVPFDQVRAQIGKGGDQLMPVFFTTQELEAFGKELEEYRRQHFRFNYLPTLKPFPRVRELLQRVRSEGQRLVIASSSNREDLNALMHLCDITDLVDDSVSGDDAEESKPEPDIYLAALKKLDGMDPNDVLSVGDSPYDALAASKAGIRSIGVLCGGFLELELRAAGCLEVYKDPADLLERYTSSLLGRHSQSLRETA